MQSRQQFSQLLLDVDQDISRYINGIRSCKVVPNQEYVVDEKRKELQGVANQGFAKDDSINQAVFVWNHHDSELTAKRIVNLLALKQAITSYGENVKKLYDERTLDEQMMGSMLEGLRDDIESATQKNNKLNSDHKKEFRTYHQGRVEGLGIFCSWYQKSWVQPKSMHALEHAAARVEKYMKAFSHSNPTVKFN